MIDEQELIGKVAARNGIRLEPGDPAFALVTLNEAVLQNAVKTAAEEMRQVLNTFTESLAKTEHRAGKTLAQDVRAAAAELRRELHSDIESASVKANELVMKVSAENSRPAIAKWMAIGVVSASLLFLCGIMVGLKIVGN